MSDQLERDEDDNEVRGLLDQPERNNEQELDSPEFGKKRSGLNTKTSPSFKLDLSGLNKFEKQKTTTTSPIAAVGDGGGLRVPSFGGDEAPAGGGSYGVEPNIKITMDSSNDDGMDFKGNSTDRVINNDPLENNLSDMNIGRPTAKFIDRNGTVDYGAGN